ncbi:hypothetical protein MCEMIEM28_02179 [Burkholderiaceae bacterium]
MKNTPFAWIATVTLTLASVAAHAADMPKELLGRYVSESGTCTDNQKAFKETGMWDGVTVEKSGVSFIESSCDAHRVSKNGNSFAMHFKCSGEGEEWDVKSTYKLSGSVLTISTKEGSERFKRCGK